MTITLTSLAQQQQLQPIQRFLNSPTPQQWLDVAINQENRDTLLIDHALCEKKAASSAISLMHRYSACSALIKKMSRLAREELKHYELVLNIINRRKIHYENLPPSNYVPHMRRYIRFTEPEKLVDELIIGAIIEARSCERFFLLVPHLDDELAHFYTSLLNSESRHFEDYLTLAKTYAKEDITQRIALFTEKESEYINISDSVFRFHSGILEK
jgi:tRNA-(ms[2]io[6]A)-hydroxylase